MMISSWIENGQITRTGHAHVQCTRSSVADGTRGAGPGDSLFWWLHASDSQSKCVYSGPESFLNCFCHLVEMHCRKRKAAGAPWRVPRVPTGDHPITQMGQGQDRPGRGRVSAKGSVRWLWAQTCTQGGSPQRLIT